MRLTRLLVVALVAAVLVLAGCATTAPVDSGVRGTVTIGASEASTAVPQPYSADLLIKPQGGRSSVAQVKSAPDGRFRATLEPGNYVIRAASSEGSASLKPVTVTVVAHQFSEVTVPFDSGIR